MEIESILQFGTPPKKGEYRFFINVAASIDGKIALQEQRVNLSNNADWKIVHSLRNQAAAILVGSNTIAVDNSSLLTKAEYVESTQVSHPVRIIVDPHDQLSGNEKVFHKSGSTVLYVHPGQLQSNVDWIHNIKLLYSKQDTAELQHQIMGALEVLGIDRGYIMIEGGASIISSFLQWGNVHRMRIFRASLLLGSKGVQLFSHDERTTLHLRDVQQLDNGIQELYNIL